MQPMTIILCGDILPTRRLANPGPATRSLYQLIGAADIAIGNFEMPLTRDEAPIQKLLNIRADPKIAMDVPTLGFTVLTLANNHAVDYGWPGLQATASLLRKQGLAVIGLGCTRDQAASIELMEYAGRRVGIVAFSCLTPTGTSAGPDRPGISGLHVETSYEIDPWYQMEEPGDPSAVKIRTRVRDIDRLWAEDVVRRARSVCEFLVVTIHWGYGSGDELAEYQLPLGQALVDAGADIVHGHHPHAVHPVGYHRGKPILFGLGTFIGQQVFLPASPKVQALWAGMSPDGVVAKLQFDHGREPVLTLHPTTLDAERLPIPARDAIFDRIADRLERLSAPYGAAITREDGVLRIEPL
jgi:poly-gamma-glutamate synthesis protein (capsule biosynthesis protein)